MAEREGGDNPFHPSPHSYTNIPKERDGRKHRVNTEWHGPLSIMMVKSAQPGEGGVHARPLYSICHRGYKEMSSILADQ